MVDYPSILHLLHIPKLTYTYKSLVATALLVTNFAVPLCIYYLLLMICCQFLNFVIPSNNEIEYCTVCKKKNLFKLHALFNFSLTTGQFLSLKSSDLQN